jgi:hypothetical protein
MGRGRFVGRWFHARRSSLAWREVFASLLSHPTSAKSCMSRGYLVPS